VVAHPNGGRVAVHVAKEAFFSAVLHLDRSAGAKREEAAVNLQADVFSGAKGTANSTQH
jgi:hypothetical protein